MRTSISILWTSKCTSLKCTSESDAVKTCFGSENVWCTSVDVHLDVNNIGIDIEIRYRYRHIETQRYKDNTDNIDNLDSIDNIKNVEPLRLMPPTPEGSRGWGAVRNEVLD